MDVDFGWIAVNDRGEEGFWVGLNDEPVKYIYWAAPYQPDNMGNQDCAGIKPSSDAYWDGMWDDGDCNRQMSYVCQKVHKQEMVEFTDAGGSDLAQGSSKTFHIQASPSDLSEVVLHCQSATGDALTINKIVLESEQGTYTGVVNAVFDDAVTCNTRRVSHLAHDKCYEYAHDRVFVASVSNNRYTEFRGTSYYEVTGPSKSHDAWLQECKNSGGDGLAFIGDFRKVGEVVEFLRGDLSLAEQRAGTEKRAVCGKMSMDLDALDKRIYECNDKDAETFGSIDPDGKTFGDYCLSIISTGLETKKVACSGGSALTGALCEKKLIKGMSRCCFEQVNVPLTKG